MSIVLSDEFPVEDSHRQWERSVRLLLGPGTRDQRLALHFLHEI